MIRVPADVKTKILGDNRKFDSAVQMNFLSLRFDTSVAISATNAQDGSIPDQIVEDSVEYRPDRLFLGSSLPAIVFPTVANIYAGNGYTPRRSINKTRVGYIGALSNGAGLVDDLVGVRIAPRLTRSVSIVTDPNRLLNDFVLTLYTQDRTVVATRVVTDNDQAELYFDFPDVTVPTSYYELHITRATPNKRIWIIKFTPALAFSYGSNEIVKWSLAAKKSQNRDATIGRLYIRSLDVQLFNTGRAFDFFNQGSAIYGALKPNVELVVGLSLEGTKFPIGTFYADNWDVPESAADVNIKAVDLLGKIKDNLLDAEIVDQITASAAFALVASKLGLSDNSIESSLSSIVLRQFALGDTVGNILNRLCENTHATCIMNTSNTGLVVKRLAQLRGRSRYPSRYLSTNDYASSKPTSGDPSPTVLEVDYTIQEYEQAEVILTSEAKVYSDIPLRTYPPGLEHVPTYNREIGAGLAPSWISPSISKPLGFTRVEFSDPFSWGSLEYEWQEVDASHIQFKVWNFDNTSPDEQLTVSLVGNDPKPNILLSDETQAVPPRPSDYKAQAVSDDITVRNAANKPYEFQVKLTDKVAISSLVPGNRQRPGLFEYTIEPTSFGYKGRVWNYLNSEQTFQVYLYGRRLTSSQTTKALTLRDEAGIRARGEISKSVRLTDMNDDAMAKSVASGVQAYFRSFIGKVEVDPWSDPRIELGDCLATESIRGYGYLPCVVDELTLEYTGAVVQKLSTLQTTKTNRDGRVVGGYVLHDRPTMTKTTEGYV